MEQQALPRSFFDRDVVEVAQELLGKLLVRQTDGVLLVGRIVETEAYLAEQDPACHSARGRTAKNTSMYGPPGHAYVYSIHAKYCFNIVTQPKDVASAVLIRAIEPLVGVDEMRARRTRSTVRELTIRDIANGPAKLCQAMMIDRQFDGCDLTSGCDIWIEDDQHDLPPAALGRSVRIGVTSGQDLDLRFYVRGSEFVSGPKRMRQ